MANQARLHVLIEGRVQGVFFRAATKDEARARGLTGWVRNPPGRPGGGSFRRRQTGGGKRAHLVPQRSLVCLRGPGGGGVAGLSRRPDGFLGWCIDRGGMKRSKPHVKAIPV